MHDLGWCIIGKSMVDLLFPLIELSSLSVAVPELWGEMCTARLFSQGVDSLRSNFTWTETSPINHFWHQKTRDGMLQDSEDRIPLCSLILTQYRSVTDRQLDGYAVAYTMLAKPALQHTAKNQYKKSAWPDTPSEQACWLARVIQLSLRRGGEGCLVDHRCLPHCTQHAHWFAPQQTLSLQVSRFLSGVSGWSSATTARSAMYV